MSYGVRFLVWGWVAVQFLWTADLVPHWRDNRTLWTYARQISPNKPRVRIHYGQVIESQGKVREALAEYLAAAELTHTRPDQRQRLNYRLALSDAAFAYTALGEFQRAEALLTTVLAEEHPPIAELNYATWSLATGKCTVEPRGADGSLKWHCPAHP